MAKSVLLSVKLPGVRISIGVGNIRKILIRGARSKQGG